MRIKNLALIVLSLMIFDSYGSSKKDLATVSNVDLERYTGLWHEVARFDHRFQRKCVTSTAEYSINDKGNVDLINTCFQKEGKVTSVTGTAKVKNTDTNAELKVVINQFFPKFFSLFQGSNYYIIDLDSENYQYALVGSPSRNYLWILSRTPIISESVTARLLKTATDKGFDTTKLQWKNL